MSVCVSERERESERGKETTVVNGNNYSLASYSPFLSLYHGRVTPRLIPNMLKSDMLIKVVCYSPRTAYSSCFENTRLLLSA